MATAADRIKRAMKLLGVIASGETPTASEQADGLTALNAMLAQWSTQSLLIPARVRESFPLIGGQSSYTIGPSGDFDTSRPQRIEIAKIEIQDGEPFEVPVEILNLDQYATITVKNMQSTYPRKLYVEDGAPLSTIKVWPVPNEVHNLVLYSWKPLSSLATAATDVEFPPGYEDAIDYNLAIRLAGEFQVEPKASVVSIARDSLANIKRMNKKPRYLKCDPAVTDRPGCMNIYTGDYE